MTISRCIGWPIPEKPFLDKDPVFRRQRRRHVVNLVLLQLLDDIHRIIGIQIMQLARQRHAHHINDVVTGVFIA